jgi:hypothetical protein
LPGTVTLVTTLLAFPVLAQAATVSVTTGPETAFSGDTPSVLRFLAAPTEANHLTVTVTSEDATEFQLELVESGARCRPAPAAAAAAGPAFRPTARCTSPSLPSTKCVDTIASVRYLARAGVRASKLPSVTAAVTSTPPRSQRVQTVVRLRLAAAG